MAESFMDMTNGMDAEEINFSLCTFLYFKKCYTM